MLIPVFLIYEFLLKEYITDISQAKAESPKPKPSEPVNWGGIAWIIVIAVISFSFLSLIFKDK
jgi:hypothetical protein